MTEPAFIGVDWGTTSFRAYLADASGKAAGGVPPWWRSRICSVPFEWAAHSRLGFATFPHDQAVRMIQSHSTTLRTLSSFFATKHLPKAMCLRGSGLSMGGYGQCLQSNVK